MEELEDRMRCQILGKYKFINTSIKIMKTLLDADIGSGHVVYRYSSETENDKC